MDVMGLTYMQEDNTNQKQLDQLYDFAELTCRALELYEEIRVTTTRELLLNELHLRMSHLNGVTKLRKFQPFMVLLKRILTELPVHPEHVEVGIACAEQLLSAIDQISLTQVVEGNISHQKPAA